MELLGRESQNAIGACGLPFSPTWFAGEWYTFKESDKNNLQTLVIFGFRTH